MNHLGTRELFTHRCILRPFEERDIEIAFKNWCNDEEVTKYLTFLPHENIETTKEIITGWILQYENLDFYQWAIELKEIGEVIGSISVVSQNEKTFMFHIGYAMGKKWWGKNIMTCCLARVIHFLFTEVGANRVESMHSVHNIASGKVMEKAGMKYEGTLRSYNYSNYGISYAKMYSIIRSEYDYKLFYDIIDDEKEKYYVKDNDTPMVFYKYVDGELIEIDTPYKFKKSYMIRLKKLSMLGKKRKNRKRKI